jgi:hypothetical protein
MHFYRLIHSSALTAALVCAGSQFAGAVSASPAQESIPRAGAVPERLGPGLLKIGALRIDTNKKEISVPGFVTEASVLEFIAVKKGGNKAYESALEVDTTAINFNLGLILIGLDAANAVKPRYHIDPALPKGDPVEITIEWDEGTTRRSVRAEQLVVNQDTGRTLTEGPWVYTGSAFTDDSNAFFMAELDGPLIGFVHSPSPLIDSPRPLTGDYGANRLNPSLKLKPGTEVMLRVRALARKP